MLAWRLVGLPVLVIGGGYEAASRVSNLLPTGADIHLICPESEISPKLKPILDSEEAKGKVTRHDRHVEPTKDIAMLDWAMVLSCIEPDEEDAERSITKAIFAETQKRKIPCNCADVLECCQFWFMSNFATGPVQVGISTNGQAPGLSRRIKARLESSLEEGTGPAVAVVGRLRDLLKSRGVPQEKRVRTMSRLQKDLDMLVLAALTEADLISIADMVEKGGKPAEVSSWIANESPGCKKVGTASVKSVGAAAGIGSTKPKGDSWTDWLASWFFPKFEVAAKTAAVVSTPTPTPAPASVAPPAPTLTKQTTIPKDIPTDLSTSTIPTFYSTSPSPPTPRLRLIGGGPGSPSLLTLSSLSALQSSDIVVADRLLPPELLALIPNEKLKIAALKSGSGGKSDEAQEDTDSIVLEELQKGKIVARLKSGDPFVYGRGGEELLKFKALGYAVDVYPGVSSVTAAPLLAGIPLTHRGKADQVLLITGRGEGGSMPAVPEYEAKRTVVVLMGLGRLGKLCGVFKEKGFPDETGVAVVERAAQDGQRVVRGSLKDIVEVLDKQERKVESPVVIVVGAVSEVLNV